MKDNLLRKKVLHTRSAKQLIPAYMPNFDKEYFEKRFFFTSSKSFEYILVERCTFPNIKKLKPYFLAINESTERPKSRWSQELALNYRYLAAMCKKIRNGILLFLLWKAYWWEN